MDVAENEQDRDELSARLLGAVGRFRRGVRRSAGVRFPSDGVTSSQAEFLRFVGRNPGTSVGEAAAALGLAANTVSTLVSASITAGLVDRTPDPSDRRIGLLTLTGEAQHRFDAVRRSRRDAVGLALDGLPTRDVQRLSDALGILDRLTEALGEEHE